MSSSAKPAISFDSTLKWLVQPDCSVKNVSMVNGDCGKITSKQGFVPVLSGIVAMYEAPSNFQVSKKVGIDVTQNRLMSNMSPSGKVNLSLKVSKNRMIQIRKPCSVRPKVVVSSHKSLLQKLINHPVERKVTIKMKEGEAGAQALVPSGFNFPSEQQSEPLPAVVNELSSPVSSSALGEMVNNNRPTVNGSKGSQESKIGKGHVRTKLVAVPLVSEDSLSRDATKKSPMVIIMRKRANPTSQNEISKSEVDTQKTKSETANVASHYPRKQSWKPAVKQWFSCTECPARFRFGASLADHAAKHHRVFLCTECEVNFELQSDLGIHLKTHAGRKLHSCSDCDFKSKSEAGLRTHWKVHSKGKLFSCGRCFAEFNKSLSFQAHLLGHKFEKLYKCDNCRANFTSKDGIRGHMVIHANENPFRCTTCPARFKKAASLRNHLKGHHVCSFCPAKFKLKVKLKAHLAMHQ